MGGSMWTTKQLHSFQRYANIYLPELLDEYMLKTHLNELITSYKDLKIQIDELKQDYRDLDYAFDQYIIMKED